MGSVRAVRADTIPAGPASDGMIRKMTDIDDGVGVAEARMAAQTSSGWHHHGDHTTHVYVREGKLRVEWGPGGSESLDLAAGDFYVISPSTIHRESNPGSADQVIIAFYVGSGPKLVNVESAERELSTAHA